MSIHERGFHGMSKEKRQLISRLGGKAAHLKGTAYQWTGGPDGTAAQAGRKGGIRSAIARLRKKARHD